VGGPVADLANGVAADSSGNVYITGQYQSNPLTIFNLDGSTFTTLAHSGSNDAFVIKYNPTGNPVWATRIAGSSDERGVSIAVDDKGNVYVSGRYSSNPVTVFNLNGTSFRNVPLGGITNAFLVKYDTNGTPLWASRFGGESVDLVHNIAVDSKGEVYLTGQYSSTLLDFYKADGTLDLNVNLSNAGGIEAFLVKYSTEGNPIWANRLTGAGNEFGFGVAVDSNGNVYTTGFFTSTPMGILNLNQTPFQTLPNSGTDDVYVIKYTTNGNPVWATRLGGTASDRGNKIAVDGSGNVYVTGQYNSNPLTIFQTNGASYGTLTGTGNMDVFVVKYNTDGLPLWWTRVTGSGNTDTPNGIAVDGSGNVYITGRYNSSPLFIVSSNNILWGELPLFGSSSVFLVKYNTSGIVDWATRMAGNAGNDSGNGIFTDSSGNVFVTGQYANANLVLHSAGF
jgi:sugar lactone lactonase YvrE